MLDVFQASFYTLLGQIQGNCWSKPELAPLLQSNTLRRILSVYSEVFYPDKSNNSSQPYEFQKLLCLLISDGCCPSLREFSFTNAQISSLARIEGLLRRASEIVLSLSVEHSSLQSSALQSLAVWVYLNCLPTWARLRVFLGSMFLCCSLQASSSQ